jgi:hypothetical protein
MHRLKAFIRPESRAKTRPASEQRAELLGSPRKTISSTKSGEEPSDAIAPNQTSAEHSRPGKMQNPLRPGWNARGALRRIISPPKSGAQPRAVITQNQTPPKHTEQEMAIMTSVLQRGMDARNARENLRNGVPRPDSPTFRPDVFEGNIPADVSARSNPSATNEHTKIRLETPPQRRATV